MTRNLILFEMYKLSPITRGKIFIKRYVGTGKDYNEAVEYAKKAGYELSISEVNMMW